MILQVVLEITMTEAITIHQTEDSLLPVAGSDITLCLVLMTHDSSGVVQVWVAFMKEWLNNGNTTYNIKQVAMITNLITLTR